MWVQGRVFVVVCPVVRGGGRSSRRGVELDFLASQQQWLVKVRRDVGPHFGLSGTAQVCSLHFYESDINKGRLSRHKSFLPYVFMSSEPLTK